MGIVLAATLWTLVRQSEELTRRAGLPVTDLYVVFPRPAAWWVALLMLPPVLLVAAQFRIRRRLARA
jgi:hypothetical protein